MFEAQSHSLLVPYDGTFDVHAAPTKPTKNKDKDDWKERLEDEVKALGDAQHRLYADGRFGVLLVFQALDAGGKDSTIRHVFSGVNPMGLHVVSFRQPSHSEQSHDFLWRTAAHLPARGTVSIFNRSYYEEVLVVRVHPEFLAAQHLPIEPPVSFWDARLRAIADHERYLAEQGIVILKFWLNVSKAEQGDRLLERLEKPDKQWKFNPRDLVERALRDRYLEAYGHALNATSRPWAPWYAIPADDKHFMRWQVAKLVNDALAALGVDFPLPKEQSRDVFDEAKKRLLAERN